ncbi:MAG: type II toxin-antitoxin system RelE/ParE family toxin [Candidatus Sumerlaeota bacterium]|nr:type II toxin-antitoxin system RelE/ParE family toxin [Candidatus Sumerlaeota bacterium]
MVKVIWTESALMDLGSIIRYIALDSPVYARRIGFKIIAATENLEQFPFSGRKVPEYNLDNIREIIFGSYRRIIE